MPDEADGMNSRAKQRAQEIQKIQAEANGLPAEQRSRSASHVGAARAKGVERTA